MNEIMSEEEVAKMLGVHLRTMQRQRADNSLPFPHVRVGERVLYAREAVMQAFFKQDASAPVPAPAPKPLVRVAVKRGRGRPRKNTGLI